MAEYSTLLVPSGHTYLVQPLSFNGPCKSPNLFFQVEGGIVAPKSPNEWNTKNKDLISFVEVVGLSLNATATIDGRGKPWWDASCRDHPKLQGCFGRMPTTVVFLHCTRVKVVRLLVVNSPQTHILVWNSDSVELNYLSVNSPANSPNTDGLHIQASTNVSIHHSIIKSGDDCVSIGDQSSHISIINLICGPGHGVSIGSLGKDGSVANVSNIKVHRVKFFGTSNGVRIKTYQVGKGIVQHVEFRNLTFYDVQNPIVIDQHYCFDPNGCHDLATAVHIDNIIYSGAKGTSASEVALNLNCSKTVACTNIKLEDIQITPSKQLKSVESSCNNAHGVTTGIVKPASCL
ncbi:probable polygalacturonase At1g80170 [Cannabis sativa]|uniref:probable polygalacturonase At1g80170 n=1 Tax=Cannabis sativa TaxID=3483 RepID=UPI0029C9CD27|nr:probable polygalacturonase At1g80170 [Cannabis sativa]